MAVTEVFAMKNKNATCTVAALIWSRMVLMHQTPRADQFGENDTALASLMYTVGVTAMDSDIIAGASRGANLAVVESSKGNNHSSSTEIATKFSRVEPHVGIFWNSFHTMGYAYGHLKKHYFDNNIGLFSAKLTADIVAKMEAVRTGTAPDGYGGVPWEGYAILKLPPNLFKLK